MNTAITDSAIALDGIDAIRALLGAPAVASGWRRIDQATIDAFAATTGDHQWIHVDPKRAAAESPYVGTIAHGFLTLSLLSTLFGECYRFPTRRLGVNYGFDRVRFTGAVPVDSDVRAQVSLEACDDTGAGAVRTAWDVKIEVAGQDRLALVARWLVQMTF